MVGVAPTPAGGLVRDRGRTAPRTARGKPSAPAATPSRVSGWRCAGAEAGGSPRRRGTTGLCHVAIRSPTRAALGDALRRLRDAGIPLDGASDHGVSEALYLHDPDGNGLELYRDRPKEEWPRDAQGRLTMISEPV